MKGVKNWPTIKKVATALLVAASEELTEILSILIDETPSQPDPINSQGQSILSAAAANGYFDVVDILLNRNKMSISTSKDKTRRTAQSVAAFEGHHVVGLLLTHPNVEVNT